MSFFGGLLAAVNPVGLLGTALATGGNIAGALISKSASDNTNEVNRKNFTDQQAMEDYYARNSIQLRAADARAAGVNVNTAIGAPSVGSAVSAPNYQAFDAGPYVSNAFGNLGQNLSNILTREQENSELNQLTLERARLENDLLRSQISVIKSPARQTKLPSAVGNTMGQGNSFVVNPSEVQSSASGRPSEQAGVLNEYQYIRGSDGIFRAVPSKDAKERIEDSLPLEADWYLRNRIFTPPRPSNEYLGPDEKYWKVPGGWKKGRPSEMDLFDRVYNKFNSNW